jgi:peptidoglycan/LPS O-acetylase OafA/YrhL
MMQKNNFDFLRLLFALFVVIDHSYVLSGVKALGVLTYIALNGFFAISGFLIFKSIQKTDSLISFYWRRILRIYPALIVVTLLTVLLAPFVYHNDQISYWHNKTVWQYFVGSLSLFTTHVRIDGVFENNPYKNFINGSLWTIGYEVTMYVFFSCLFFFRKNSSATKSILIISFFVLSAANVFFYVSPPHSNDILIKPKLITEIGNYYVCGALLACFKIDKSPYRKIIFSMAVCVSVLLLIIAKVGPEWTLLGNVLFFSTTIICFGIHPIKFINTIEERIGDLSYGIYIYSFPIQQTLVYYWGPNQYQLMISSAAIAICFACFSWHVVESKALQLKNIQPFELLGNLRQNRARKRIA